MTSCAITHRFLFINDRVWSLVKGLEEQVKAIGVNASCSSYLCKPKGKTAGESHYIFQFSPVRDFISK